MIVIKILKGLRREMTTHDFEAWVRSQGFDVTDVYRNALVTTCICNGNVREFTLTDFKAFIVVKIISAHGTLFFSLREDHTRIGFSCFESGKTKTLIDVSLTEIPEIIINKFDVPRMILNESSWEFIDLTEYNQRALERGYLIASDGSLF